MNIRIVGTGSFLPKKTITNEDLSQRLDTSDEWITTRTGIKKRHISDVHRGESCSDMAYEASMKALKNAELKPEDLDMIVMATVTPDFRLPASGVSVQARLGIKNIPAFDIQAACAGSIYGLNIAYNFIATGQCKRVLFVASEVMSSIINRDDRNTAILFGDGASAAVLAESSHLGGFLDFKICADGRYQKTIFIPAGGSLECLDQEKIGMSQDKIFMNGRETYKFAVTSMCEAIEIILAKNNLKKSDINFIVPHQANLRIIEAIAERVDMPLEKFLINLDRYANTSAASLILAYDESIQKNKIRPGDNLLFLAIGAGFVWGAALYRQ